MPPPFSPQLSRAAPAPPVYPPLLPPPGVIPPATSRNNPFRHALHQAHLRDPYSRLVARGLDGEEGEGELFPYLSAFPVGPTPLGPKQCAFAWEFTLSPTDCQRFPQFLGTPVGQRSSRVVRDGNQIYRLRCIRVSPPTTAISPSAWSVADAVWPSLAYVFVNGAELSFRRKLHHGKDLPLEITRHLRPGTNTVTLHLIRNAAESKDQFYAAAVEVLDITSFTRAIQLATLLPAGQCRERIRQRLHPATRDDDDVSIVSEELTVSLVDPFTARIFDRPVRGQRCAHHECFDHDTWIRTRAAKSDRQALKDDWKCPICGRDARPQNLVIDGFLCEVRNILAATNRLEGARAIQVKSDGSWTLKEEADRPAPQHGGAGPEVARGPPKRKSISVDDRPASLTQRPKIEQARSHTQTQTMGYVRCSPTEVISLD
ncbi:hypothetical protein P168DRAFT_288426 [Aspergillus campestris IBT 28561]|uniref:SP-RING-type domain-containing protein n=1 Tax=Aspergillus campestris (strain IBT 28561) TaxID=1392248 RepID=A0A2I1D9C7_ASPC2|nr:uncharacterized protein P168DRAFT_288426 [Aspergillus campestris IBT 28561]PKY06484.1 hypothetical protein P168DRAFT_288426 [Aspergillus campestris IBT 28561]